jgi:hypothetical protein
LSTRAASASGAKRLIVQDARRRKNAVDDRVYKGPRASPDCADRSKTYPPSILRSSGPAASTSRPPSSIAPFGHSPSNSAN